MARRVPNQAKENNAHYRRSERYVSMLDGVYQKATDEAVNLALLANHSGDDPFKWSDYPQTKSKLDQITRSFAEDVRGVVVNGASAEWTQSNDKNDRLARAMLGVKKGEPIAKRLERYFNHNDKALAQFISRKDVGGMNLSKRVWNLTEQFKSDLELSLSDGLSNGKSAAELSRDVRKNLNEPSKLFRRVRDDKGNLQLSNPAKSYHPGAGVCRSSYKNAQRLTRTEINMAYRNADRERWSQMDFVVGFEVKRSGRGYDCSVCESLAGKYPKDFKFVGWHPSCRCYVIPVLKTDEEFWAWDGRGEAPTGSVNEVRVVPNGFADWVDKNSHRINDATKKGTLPYFLRDNSQFIDLKRGASKVTTIVEAKAIPIPATPTIQQRADERHAARTATQVEGIQGKWDERKNSHLNTYRPTEVINKKQLSEEFRYLQASNKWLECETESVEFHILQSKNANGATYMTGDIHLSSARMRLNVSGVNKLKIGEQITFKEADALSTTWHEVTHNRNKFGNMSLSAEQTKFMEMANEFVSRNTLDEFYSAYKTNNPYPELALNRESTGYNKMVKAYNRLAEKTSSDISKVVSDVKNGLFNRPYTDQLEVLVDGITKNNTLKKLNGALLDRGDIEYLIKLCRIYDDSSIEKVLNEIISGKIR